VNLYAFVLGAAWLFPLALALGLACRPRAMNAARWVTWGPLPALLLALIGASDRVVDMPALLVGARFAMDDTGRVFLAFTAVVWMVAGGYARRYLAGDPRAPSFCVFFLLAEAGNGSISCWW
jgi:hydrogenase-4 component B